MKYYTSDLHFNHASIIKYENRPFTDSKEMDRSLIEKWNSKVRGGDEVYVLGDFAFSNGIYANSLLHRLNGQKFMIIGNHDAFLQDKTFDKNLFVWTRYYAKINDSGRKVILFHYPIAVWDCAHHGAIHLYGHVHSNTTGHHPLLLKLPDTAINVGVDVNDYEPKTLDELIKRK